jgi:hypothetical protein
MAEIDAVYAVPHTPSFVADVQFEGERSEAAQFFARMRSHLEGSKTDRAPNPTVNHPNRVVHSVTAKRPQTARTSAPPF